MICAKHKMTYVGKCPKCAKCDEEALTKEKKLEEKLGKPLYRSLNWNVNPLYDGDVYDGERRRYPTNFRSNALSAVTLLTKKYKDLLPSKKLKDFEDAFNGNLDDIFAVSRDDLEWTNVVQALGGKHGDVYGDDGKFLGTWQSYGCTTYSRVDVNPSNNHASSDKHTSMMALFDDSKRIYLHGTDAHLATLTHELLHYFCDKRFYGVFGSSGVGPEWKTLNEGITEYLTRQAYTGENHGAYEHEVGKVQILLKAGLSKSDLEAAYFRGEMEALVDKMKTGEMKAEDLTSDPRMATRLSAAPRRGKRVVQGATNIEEDSKQ
jgi:hypothetical protein